MDGIVQSAMEKLLLDLIFTSFSLRHVGILMQLALVDIFWFERNVMIMIR